MNLRDFLMLVAICLVWAVNSVVSKVVVSTWDVPPLFYAALRFGIVVMVTLPWLLPMPRPAWPRNSRRVIARSSPPEQHADRVFGITC